LTAWLSGSPPRCAPRRPPARRSGRILPAGGPRARPAVREGGHRLAGDTSAV